MKSSLKLSITDEGELCKQNKRHTESDALKELKCSWFPLEAKVARREDDNEYLQKNRYATSQHGNGETGVTGQWRL